MVDLWHDRAVLHFFVKKNQQEAYFDLLKSKIRSGGYVIFSEFAKDGAKKCCGLFGFLEWMREGLLLGYANSNVVYPNQNNRRNERRMVHFHIQ